MGIIKDKFSKKGKAKHKIHSNTEAMPISEATRVLEYMGISIYTENKKGEKTKIAGGHAPSATAIEAYNKGVALLERGKIKDALEMFRQALDDSPDYTDARYNLACILFKLGRYEEAEKEYELLLMIQPLDVDALNNLGTIYVLNNNLEKAKSLFEKALGMNPDFALTHRNLAAYYQAVGDDYKKEEHVKRALELDKNIFSD